MHNPNIKPPLPVQVGSYSGTLRIHCDERSIAWIDGSNVKVVEVVADHLRGDTPEVICADHPSLSLAQVYAALAYYYDHTQEVDALIQQGQAKYEEGYASPHNTLWREQMRARAEARNAGTKEKVAA